MSPAVATPGGVTARFSTTIAHGDLPPLQALVRDAVPASSVRAITEAPDVFSVELHDPPRDVLSLFGELFAAPGRAAVYARLRLEPMPTVSVLRAVGLHAAVHLPELHALGLIERGADGRLRAVERGRA